eukprot:s1267_g12.t1
MPHPEGKWVLLVLAACPLMLFGLGALGFAWLGCGCAPAPRDPMCSVRSDRANLATTLQASWNLLQPVPGPITGPLRLAPEGVLVCVLPPNLTTTLQASGKPRATRARAHQWPLGACA